MFCRKLVIASALCGAFSPVSLFAQAPVRSADIAIVAADKAAEEAAVGEVNLTADEIAAEDAWYNRHEMSLGSDGNLPGNLRVFDESGSLVPAAVKLYFLQSGQVVSQATPNDAGDFQAVGLRSGTYSVVAAGSSGFGALGLRVLPPPNRPEPPRANTIGRIREVSQPRPGTGIPLNISIIPSIDVMSAFGIARAQNAGGLGALPGAPGAFGGPPGLGGGGVGGGGGGGGGFGGAGGLLALGGAAAAGLALANNDDDDQPTNTSGQTPTSPNGT